VVWNKSRRVESTANPVRDTMYFGLAVNNGTELLKNAMLKELTAEMKSAFASKGVTVSRQAALSRGSSPIRLPRIPLDTMAKQDEKQVAPQTLKRSGRPAEK